MLKAVDAHSISRIARDVFGSGTVVSCIREIAPSKSHGITETPPSTRNLLYVVELEDHPGNYVFRFSRIEDDVYEREVENYRILSDETGIRVPSIYALDTSKRIVPTSYVVMDYLAGKLWQYVAHPDNPTTTPQEKEAVTQMVGRFYARTHESSLEMPESGIEARTIGYCINRLEQAARMGNVPASESQIERCRRAVQSEPLFQEQTLRLCLADTELHVIRKGDRWTLAFACDAEWVEFRHPYADLTQRLAGALPWWTLEVPTTQLDPDEIAASPFFQGYGSIHDVDYDALLYHGAYYQLCLWAYLAFTSRSPDKKMWIRQAKGPLISSLVRIAARRAEEPQPAT